MNRHLAGEPSWWDAFRAVCNDWERVMAVLYYTWAVAEKLAKVAGSML